MSEYSKDKPPRHIVGERFIKGPIPWEWIAEAARLGGSALKVAIALWLYAGMTNSRSIRLSNGILSELGLNRSSKYRSLKKLEERQLISTEYMPGRSPIVTLLDFPTQNTVNNMEEICSTIFQDEENKCKILKLPKSTSWPGIEKFNFK